MLSTFSHVYMVTESPDDGASLWRLAKDEWRKILNHNCFHSHFVNDMVVTNAPWRLEVARAAEREGSHRAAEWHEAIVDRDAAKEELAALRAERDAMRAQLDALRNSTSWKITSGLRAIGRAFKPRA